MSLPVQGKAPLAILFSVVVLACSDDAAAQTARFRFVAADMMGGATFPDESETGVAFGTRVSVVDLFAGALHVGGELDWWAADHRNSAFDVRNAVFGVGLWHEPLAGDLWRPFVGLGAGLHSVDVRRDAGVPSSPEESAEAARLDGVRPGAAIFGGLAARLTGTGAIWLVLEYRYAAVSRLSFHELRLGVRLTAGRQR